MGGVVGGIIDAVTGSGANKVTKVTKVIQPAPAPATKSDTTTTAADTVAEAKKRRGRRSTILSGNVPQTTPTKKRLLGGG